MSTLRDNSKQFIYVVDSNCIRLTKSLIRKSETLREIVIYEQIRFALARGTCSDRLRRLHSHKPPKYFVNLDEIARLTPRPLWFVDAASPLGHSLLNSETYFVDGESEHEARMLHPELFEEDLLKGLSELIFNKSWAKLTMDKNTNRARDIVDVHDAITANVNAYLTCDKAILNCRDTIHDRWELNIMTFEEFKEEIQNLNIPGI